MFNQATFMNEEQASAGWSMNMLISSSQILNVRRRRSFVFSTCTLLGSIFAVVVITLELVVVFVVIVVVVVVVVVVKFIIVVIVVVVQIPEKRFKKFRRLAWGAPRPRRFFDFTLHLWCFRKPECLLQQCVGGVAHGSSSKADLK